MKKLFVLLLAMVIGVGLVSASANPEHPPGVQSLEMALSGYGAEGRIVTPDTVPAMRLEVVFAMAGCSEVALTQDLDLICLWADRYREGLLTQDEFKTLVTGRIVVMYRRDQADVTGGMRALAKKTKEKVDRFFYLRELKMGIRKVTSLAPGEFPLLC
jgi:hypothetical protein